MLYYFVVFVVLLGVELLYFRVANYFNIIDKPNERSSHSRITLRGGGIVFYVGALVYFVISGFSFPWFMLGLTLIAGVSFVDDVRSVTQRVRLVVHFMAMLLMFYQWGMLALPWWYVRHNVPLDFAHLAERIRQFNNEEMKLAAVHAIADLAKQPVPFRDPINPIHEIISINDPRTNHQSHHHVPPRQCQHSPLVKHQ